MHRPIRAAFQALALLASTVAFAQQEKVDPALPNYAPAIKVQGTLKMTGSESIEPLALELMDEFKKFHPDAKLEYIAKGSGSGPKALMDGTALLAPMSREMTPEESAACEKKFGHPPTRVAIAIDALAVFVQANNPIKEVGLAQLDAVYSSTRKGGYAKDVETWGDLGVAGALKGMRIEAMNRDAASGTRAFFRDAVLLKGDFKPGIKEVADQFSILESLSVNGAALGYGPLSFGSSLVKALPLVPYGAKHGVEPTEDNIRKGLYPLTRFFFIYMDKAPGKPLPALEEEFIVFTLSRQGQTMVSQFGSLTMPADLARLNRARIQR
jgi:phosphate transport system substrate-binding protein